MPWPRTFDQPGGWAAGGVPVVGSSGGVGTVVGGVVVVCGVVAGGVSEDQLPEMSPVRREQTSPGNPAFDPADPRVRQAGGQRST